MFHEDSQLGVVDKPPDDCGDDDGALHPPAPDHQENFAGAIRVAFLDGIAQRLVDDGALDTIPPTQPYRRLVDASLTGRDHGIMVIAFGLALFTGHATCASSW